MMYEFVTLPIRMTRQDPEKPDRQITDFEDMLVNLDHVQLVHKGISEDTSMLHFPGGVRQLAKGSVEEIKAKIREAYQ